MADQAYLLICVAVIFIFIVSPRPIKSKDTKYNSAHVHTVVMPSFTIQQRYLLHFFSQCRKYELSHYWSL